MIQCDAGLGRPAQARSSAGMRQEIRRIPRPKRIRKALQAVAVVCLGVVFIRAAPAQSAPPSMPPVPGSGSFVDITERSGVHFLHQAPHTSRKYLIETMGSGVALFDWDNADLLDL